MILLHATTYSIVALVWLCAAFGTASLISEATCLQALFSPAPLIALQGWIHTIGAWRALTVGIAQPVAAWLGLPLNHAFLDLGAIAFANGVVGLFYWMCTFELKLLERGAWRVINGYAEDSDTSPPRRTYAKPERYWAIFSTTITDGDHLRGLLSVEAFMRRAGAPVRFLFAGLILVVIAEAAFLVMR